MDPQPTRAEALAQVRKIVAPKFPGAAISTNDDANPATPMAVTATWRKGTIVKVVRSDTITQSAGEFARKALRILTDFQEANVPTRYRTEQPA